jgi:RNA polymerase sigma-32 factor
MKPHLDWYLEQTRKFPILDVNEERRLARDWRDAKDPEAARQLLGSHLRLVIKIARGFGGYGMPLADLVAEGNVGLMRALARFEPERGFRFATYAMWWIRAAIQAHVIRNRSLVTLGATPGRKRLFFNLRRLKSQLGELGEGDLAPATVTRIAADLEVSEDEVIEMNRRLAAMDQSLSAPMRADGEAEWQDMLVADGADQESMIVEASELEWRRDLLAKGLETLNERERHIVKGRRLRDEAMTLADLDDPAQQGSCQRCARAEKPPTRLLNRRKQGRGRFDDRTVMSNGDSLSRTSSRERVITITPVSSPMDS